MPFDTPSYVQDIDYCSTPGCHHLTVGELCTACLKRKMMELAEATDKERREQEERDELRDN